MNKILQILVVLFIFTSTILVCAAQDDNNTTVAQNETVSTPITNESVATTTETSTVTVQQPTQAQAVNTNPNGNGKIRQGPDVRITTIHGEVNETADTIIGIYMDNSELNDGTMHVSLTITVPRDIVVNSQDSAVSGGAGIVKGHYDLVPGQNMYCEIHAIGSKVGTYTVTSRADYWIGDDKDAFKTIALATDFLVVSPSTGFHIDNVTPPVPPVPLTSTSFPLNNTEMVIGGGFILVALVIALARK